jgi:hypothetical protein
MTFRYRHLPTVGLLLLGAAWSCGTAGAKLEYNRDVRPILSDRCFHCHGPDSAKRKAGLRLDDPKAAFANLAGEREPARHALVAGDPGSSEVVRHVFSNDPDEIMPPPESKLVLTEREKETLRQWIVEGGEYEPHWSFIPLKPEPVPEVEVVEWCRNEIDRFVLKELRETPGLNPAPEAAKEVLARRLYFDLTGLPPTPEQVRHFVADPSPLAYEKLVAQLLESPHYSERMAVDWLDVARYADSYGYQVDRDRTVWRWRDWVIEAFEKNMPYDQFITEQLAGDLLPNATDDQVLATTFNRLHQQKVEGGSVSEEFRVEYVADRTHTFGTTFLGLTLECSRCHDHKYDPILQKEYYQLSAYFSNIDESGLYSYFTNSIPTPVLAIRGDDAKKKTAELEAVVKREEKKLAELRDQRKKFEEWLNSNPKVEQVAGGEIARFEFEEIAEGKIANLVKDGKPVSPGANALVAGRSPENRSIQLTGDDAVGLSVGNFPRHQPFSVSTWMWTPDKKERAVVYHRSRAWTDSASRGYQLLIEESRISGSLIHFWPGNALRVRTKAEVQPKKWTHVTMTWDGSSRASGLRLYLDGELADSDVVRDNLYKNITGSGGDNITLGQRFRDKGFKGGRLDDFRVFDRELTALEASDLFEPIDWARVLMGDDRDELHAYYLMRIDEEYRAQLATVQSAREARNKDQDGVEEIMAMREKAGEAHAYVLERGHYENRREKVKALTPAALPPVPKGAPPNRLGLAQWLIDPGHPLTARVAVNRFWQGLFGRGLVGTPEDFGSQGELPIHGELLDWLSLHFIESGWDIKKLLTTIVTSSTYRQQSFASAKVVAVDPENRLLARGPSYRLAAEMIRDNALAVSGLLVEKRGGPPVKPYDVAESFTPSNPDSGENLYRRSVYSYWKMSGPMPVMIALDAAKRDVCTVKRERTSSPLQALVLLNDPQITEASRKLAERCMKTHGDDLDAMVGDMFERLTSRQADAQQRDVLSRLYQNQLKYFSEDARRAEALLKTGKAPRDESLPLPELAATSVLAKALFNYDECVTKR